MHVRDEENTTHESIDILSKADFMPTCPSMREKRDGDEGMTCLEENGGRPDETLVGASDNDGEEGVTIDPGNLMMIGLNNEGEALWRYRLTLFICSPEEFRSVRRNTPSVSFLSERYDNRGHHDDSRQRTRPFLSYVRTREGSSLMTEIDVLRRMFPDREERSLLVFSDGDLDDVDLDFDGVPISGQYPIASMQGDSIATQNICLRPLPGSTIQKCLRMDLGVGTSKNGHDAVHLGKHRLYPNMERFDAC
jgi:hypothetical protein